ncbi:MAG TPA: YbhN family protein [Acidimicrobiales bacterium]
MSELQPDAGSVPLAPAEVAERRSRAAVTVRRSVKILLFLFVFNYLVLPQIAGVQKAFDELLDVKPGYLVAGLGLQVAALVAYSMLTRAALPQGAVKFGTLLRIQMSTKAVTNVVPGGSAAGSALGYRLMTLADVSGADAGFALATSGLGSAVVLNVILWLALVVSIPLAGFNPLYFTAAVVGVILMGFAAFLVVGLMKGQARAERRVRAIGRRVKWIDEEKAVATVNRLAARLRELGSNRRLLAHVVVWAAANWLLDMASLGVFLKAFGGDVPIVGLVVAFCLANVMAAIPITPGGLGIVEGILIPTLVGFGVPRSVALVAVPTYRLAQFWLPIPMGAIAYGSLRVGPFAIPRVRVLPPLRREAAEVAAQTTESRLAWSERYGRRSKGNANGRTEPDGGVTPTPQ